MGLACACIYNYVSVLHSRHRRSAMDSMQFRIESKIILRFEITQVIIAISGWFDNFGGENYMENNVIFVQSWGRSLYTIL